MPPQVNKHRSHQLISIMHVSGVAMLRIPSSASLKAEE